MARDQLVPVRYTRQEKKKLQMRAKIRGMTVGQYVRFRTLGPEQDQELRISELEKKVGVDSGKSG